MENKKKPAIRFKGFCDDWEQRKLGKLILEYKETVDSSCMLPVLTSSKTEGVILQEEHFGRKQQHDITGYNVLPRSYCTYRNRSDGVDFTFNVNECCDMGIISKFYPVFCGNNNDTYFLSLVLNNSDEVVHEIAYTCTGTGQKVLSFLDLQKMSIRVPQHSEQKKISIYFKQLDYLITLHQRKYDKLQVLRKSMLEKMFPKNSSTVPEIRFKGFTHPWEQRKLGDVSESYSGGTPSVENKSYYGGSIPFIRSAEINSESTELFLTEEGLINSSARMVSKGDILYALYGATSGETGRSHINGAINQAILAILPHNEYDSEFLMQWLRKSKQNITDVYLQGGQGNLSGAIVKTLEVNFPSPAEQRQIGNYFQSLDHLITLHHRKLEKLQNIKKSLLEKMFV